MSKKRIAIIPARGGSKRIPGKNIKDFLGRPIIAYSIELALQSGLFDEVMVSTDDPEIAEVAKRDGARVPFLRSSKNSDDFATTADVLIEVLLDYQDKLGIAFDQGCCFYPTAPLASIKHLEEGYRKLEEHQFDTVFPVVAFSYPIWRGLELTQDEKVAMLWPENYKARSQDLKKVYHDAGQWYWFHSEPLLDKQQLYTDNSGFVELSEMEVQDIDNETDWALAEMKYTYLLKNRIS